MKRKMIAALLATVIAVSPLGTVGTMAAEQAVAGDEVAENVAEKLVVEAEETVAEATVVEEQVAATAEVSGICGKTVTWSLENGTLHINGNGATYDYEHSYEWDDSQNDYVDSFNTPWYDYRDEITEVFIEDGITYLGDYLFINLKNVKTIDIPASVIGTGYSVFVECLSLETVNLPEGLENIESSLFSKCSALVSIKLPDSLKSIEYNAFSYCSSLKNIEIPVGVTSIGPWAFGNCSSLGNIKIPVGVTSIEYQTFSGCSSLENIEIPVGVTSIGSSAFNGCSSLKSITIPSGVTIIENYTFNRCSSLETIKIPDGITEISWNAFSNCSNLKSINIPSGVTSIGSSAFSYCSSLESINIPSGVTSIENSTFSGCSSLESIEIPSGVTSIGSSAFDGCSSLKNIEIPEGVTNIGSDAFYDCQNLQTLTIPENVVNIGSYAFYYCNNLKELRFCGSAPQNVSKCIFTWSDSTKMFPYVYYPAGNFTWTWDVMQIMGNDNVLWIPYGDTTVEILVEPQDVEVKSGYTAQFDITAAGEGLTYQWQYSENGVEWYDMENGQSKLLKVKATEVSYKRQYRCIVTDIHGAQDISESAVLTEKPLETQGSCGKTATWLYEDGILYIQGSGTTNSYFQDGYWDDFAGEYITTVNTPWYDHHNKITEVVIEEGITSLGSYLFSCLENLKTVNFSNTVTSVEDYVFWKCLNLEMIELPEGLENIGYEMFYDCRNLKECKIPTSVATIESYAFENCDSLRKITIPESVTSIGYSIFSSSENLEEITFGGDVPSGNMYIPNYGKIIRVYYPAGNSTWTYDVMMNMGPNALWIPYGDTTVEILVHPQDVESKAGRTAKFTVKAAGEGITYQWQYSDDNGANWKNSEMEGNQTDTLSVKVNEENFGRLYRCVVRDHKNEAISDSAVLQKKILPTEGTCGKTATWLYEDGTLTITGSGATYDYEDERWWDYSIQEYVGNGINTPWYDYYDEVTEVVIDDEITYLGEYLFADFEKLNTVNVPQGVTHIGAYAFSHCFSLETIDLPEGLAYIGAYAFDVWSEDPECNAFWNLSIPSTVTFIGNYAFRGCHFEKIEIPESFELFYSNIRNINLKNNHIFDSCKQLKKVQLPEKMEVIPMCMFYGCSALEECNLPDSITDICDYAFSYSGIKFTELPQNLKRITQFAFWNAPNIRTITIPESVEEIGDRSFAKCENLEKIIFTGNPPSSCHLEGLTNKGYYPAGNAEWTEERMQAIGSSMTWIPYGDVNEILTITEQPEDIKVAVGDTVSFMVKATGKELSYQWQYSDDGVTWNDSETEESQTDTLNVEVSEKDHGRIYRCIIKDGNGAEAVSDPAVLKVTGGSCGENATWHYADGTLSIEGTGATYDYELDESMSIPVAKIPWYKYCDQITAVSIDNGITHLGSYLFAYLRNVKEISIPESVESLGACAFTESGLQKIVLPASVETMAYGIFMNCSELTTVTLPEKLAGIPDSAFEGCKKLTNVFIPDGIAFVGSSAFMDCLSLETLELPEGLEAIYDGAFDVRSGAELEGCKAFRNISIPSTVKHIGYGAFRGCNFEEITIPESTVTIEGSVFEYCTKLNKVHLPETMNEIPEYMFDNCRSLEECKLPASVTHISDGAFSESGIKNIALPQGMEVIADHAFDGCANLQTLIILDSVTVIGRGAFMNCENLNYLKFYGNAPSEPLFCIGNNRHTLINTVYYPAENATWTSEVMETMGPDATWILHGNEAEKLTITEQPKNIEAEAGETVNFTVKAAGEGLTYQWQYSTSGKYWFKSGMEGNQTDTLTVEALTKRNGQMYRCLVTDVYGTTVTSEGGILTIVEKPVYEIVKQPEDVTAKEGITAKFTVEVSQTEEAGYQWQYSNNGRYWFNSGMEGNQTAVLKVPAAVKRNGQQYRCVIKYADGTILTSDSAVLTVEEKTAYEIIRQPEDVIAKEGTTAEFAIEVSQAEDAGYQWQYSNNGKYWFNSGMEGNQTAVLKVPAVVKRDGQQYQRVIKYADGTTLTSAAAVLIIDKNIGGDIEIVKQPENITAAVGENAVFTVEASGEGLTYQWQYSTSGKYWFNSGMEGADTESLTVQAAAKRNGQQYRCIVTNGSGVAVISAPATLTVVNNADIK